LAPYNVVINDLANSKFHQEPKLIIGKGLS
jgi:hypothetical protein